MSDFSNYGLLLSEMPQTSNSQILSNILYPIEYSYDYTQVPAGYSTFSIAYLIYSTSHAAAAAAAAVAAAAALPLLLGVCALGYTEAMRKL